MIDVICRDESNYFRWPPKTRLIWNEWKWSIEPPRRSSSRWIDSNSTSATIFRPGTAAIGLRQEISLAAYNSQPFIASVATEDQRMCFCYRRIGLVRRPLKPQRSLLSTVVRSATAATLAVRVPGGVQWRRTPSKQLIQSLETITPARTTVVFQGPGDGEAKPRSTSGFSHRSLRLRERCRQRPSPADCTGNDVQRRFDRRAGSRWTDGSDDHMRQEL